MAKYYYLNCIVLLSVFSNGGLKALCFRLSNLNTAQQLDSNVAPVRCSNSTCCILLRVSSSVVHWCLLVFCMHTLAVRTSHGASTPAQSQPVGLILHLSDIHVSRWQSNEPGMGTRVEDLELFAEALLRYVKMLQSASCCTDTQEQQQHPHFPTYNNMQHTTPQPILGGPKARSCQTPTPTMLHASCLHGLACIEVSHGSPHTSNVSAPPPNFLSRPHVTAGGGLMASSSVETSQMERQRQAGESSRRQSGE